MDNKATRPSPGTAKPSPEDRLDSWKEIAAYLRREVRTVQRWEKSAGLPVHRVPIGKQGAVYAYKADLDAWYRDRQPQIESDSTAEKRRSLFVTVPAAVAVILIAGYVAFRSIQPSAFLKKKVRLVVVPFTNLSGDPKQDYFSAGLTDEMITRLGSLDPEHLGVIAAASSNALAGKPIAEIGRALDVQYVLEGTVRRNANRVRIDAQLIQVSDQTHLWAHSYDRDLDDILRVQNDVGAAVADSTLVALKPSSARVRVAAAAKERTVNPDAYDAYLRGRFSSSRQDYRKSIDSFSQALEKDPDDALAYAGLAAAYAALGHSPYDSMSATESKSAARLAAQRALDLDPNLSEAHAVMANVSMNYDWDLKGAGQEYQRAIQLDPNEPMAHQWYSKLLVVEGRYDEAIGEMRRALDVDPVSLLANTILAETYYYARRYDEAVKQARRTIESNPQSFLAYVWLGQALQEKKLYAEAIDAFRRGSDLSDGNPLMIALYGHAQGFSGNAAEARAALQALEQMRATRFVPSIYLAAVHLSLGETSQTLDLLEQAYEERNDRMIYLGVDPIADPLRGDPRFQNLLRRIGLPQ